MSDGQIGTNGPGQQIFTGPIPYVNPFFDLDTVLKSRAVSLSGMPTQMSYWSDPFIDTPLLTSGSQWQGSNVGGGYSTSGVGGGVVAVNCNTFSTVLTYANPGYPNLSAKSCSFVGDASANKPIYMFARFRFLTAVDFVNGCLMAIGLADAHSNAVVGVGAAFDTGIGKSYLGAAHGDSSGSIQVFGNLGTIQLGVWVDMELFSRLGHWWCKLNDGVAVDVTSALPGDFVGGQPIIKLVSGAVAQPTMEVDHVAYAVPANRPFLAPYPAHPFP